MIKTIKSKINNSELKFFSPYVRNESTKYFKKKYKVELYIHNEKYENHISIIENTIEKTFGHLSKLSMFKALQTNDYWYITFMV